jgi:hypothetical protein
MNVDGTHLQVQLQVQCFFKSNVFGPDPFCIERVSIWLRLIIGLIRRCLW